MSGMCAAMDSSPGACWDGSQHPAPAGLCFRLCLPLGSPEAPWQTQKRLPHQRQGADGFTAEFSPTRRRYSHHSSFTQQLLEVKAWNPGCHQDPPLSPQPLSILSQPTALRFLSLHAENSNTNPSSELAACP